MNPYPKRILTISQQLQTYTDAGLTISSTEEATDVSDILKLYHFDMEMSRLLFSMATCIEVALRARLSDALLTYNDALILTDPAVFSDKKLFWQNMSSLSSQITRSNDVFIRHNFQNHDGEIPLWAAVEIMSFGTLSKTIKKLSVKDEFLSAIVFYRQFLRADFPEQKNKAGSLFLDSQPINLYLYAFVSF